MLNLNLNLEQLRNFVVTAKLQNLTKAAEQLYISQPTLSRMIAKLEEDLGASLFDRKGKNIQLNAYGRLVLSFAGQCFSSLDDLSREFTEMKDGNSGQVQIGCSFSEGNTGWIEACIRWFIISHPNVRFSFFEMNPEELGNALLGRNIDIAVSSTAYNEREIEWNTLYTEHLGVLMSAKNALAAKESITVEDICGERIIMVNHDSDLDRMIISFCREKGLEPNLFYRIDTPHLADEMLDRNMGISIITDRRFAADVPALGSQSLGLHSLTFRPLVGTSVSLPCRIGVLRGRTLTTAAQHMYDRMCQEAVL